MTATLTPTEFAQWTPAARRWHASKFPSTWPMLERRIKLTELAMRVKADAATTWSNMQWTRPPPEKIARTPVREPNPDGKCIPACEVIKLCAEYGHLSEAELKGPRRHKYLTTVRMAAMYLIHEHCPHMSLPMIGKAFGDRDHTTALHARNRVRADLAAKGERFGEIVAHVERELGLG